MYLVALFLLSPFVFFTYKKLIYFRKNEISNTFKSPNTYLGLIVVFNAYVFFTIGFNTLIVTLWLGMFYIITCLPTFLFFKNKIALIPTIISGLIISSFLIINHYFSSNEKQIHYHYYFNRATSTIYLDNGDFDENFGLRTFWINKKAQDFSKITYSIADGYFGIKVVKNYKFSTI